GARHCGTHRCGCPNYCPSRCRVIDGSGGAPIDNAIIVIRDGRIVSIGPSAGTPVPSGAEGDAILRQLKQLEAYGVTTVMALGLNGPLFYELRPELHAGRIPGADLFGADQGIGVVGGQPFGSQPPIGENQASRPDTVEMARESIRQMAARKTDMV